MRQATLENMLRNYFSRDGSDSTSFGYVITDRSKRKRCNSLRDDFRLVSFIKDFLKTSLDVDLYNVAKGTELGKRR